MKKPTCKIRWKKCFKGGCRLLTGAKGRVQERIGTVVGIHSAVLAGFRNGRLAAVEGLDLLGSGD